ncbi:MAG: MarR family transcriptional regulator [Bosea sp. (in: a-proteobacteria)]|nr:MarR family transcriptional regulator [Bosea sp. (in: a-proteobacteria)]
MRSSIPTVPFQTTLHVRDHCLCLYVQRAARVLARRFDEALRPHGLTNEQFSLLMSLNRPEPPVIGAVAKLLGTDRTTLTAALKPLVREGLAVVTPDPDDKRARRISLTAAGHARLLAALPVWHAQHGALEAMLVDPDAQTLRAGLETLAAWPGGAPDQKQPEDTP